MFGIPLTSVEDVKRFARENTSSFLQFAHNKKTGQFFGKTCKGWGQTLAYFLVFYSILAALFAVHLSIFLSITPEPGKDVQPTNFGRYAYPNYPNAKIELLSVPGSFHYNVDTNTSSLSSSKQKAFRDLVHSANLSGVPEQCVDESTGYGYDIRQPCILVRVMKVLEWSPEAINESLAAMSTLPLSCLADTSDGLNVELTQRPDGLPLDLPNHVLPDDSTRSYPFRGKDSNYITPVMGLVVNLASLNSSITNGVTSFSIKITCNIDLAAVGLDDPPAALSRLYEIPRSTSLSVSVRL